MEDAKAAVLSKSEARQGQSSAERGRTAAGQTNTKGVCELPASALIQIVDTVGGTAVADFIA
jgi:hypothetical protein